jgi:O-antigen/teichoic acid export membrane protein
MRKKAGAKKAPAEGRARRVSKNTFFLSLGELFSRLFTWMTILYLTHQWVTVGTYGQYATAVNWITLFVAFSDLGFNVLTIREVAHRKEKTEFYLRYVIGLKLLFAVFFYGAIVAAGLVLHYEPVLCWAMAIIGLRLFLEASSAAYIYVLQAHELMIYQGIVTVAASTFRMVGIILVVHFGGGVTAVCWVWVVDSTLQSAYLLWIGLKKGWWPRLGLFRWKEGLGVLSAGIPLAAFGTFQMLYNRFDAILL